MNALSRLCRTPAALAACEPDALRKLWQGLGYYNRVNNMQKAARIVCEQYGGDLPADYDACAVCRASVTTRRARWPALRLASPSPRWTATSCAFLRGCTTTTPTSWPLATKKAFTVRVLDQMPKATPGPYNEALMELGALVCIPGTPHCEECPLADLCRGLRLAGRTSCL